MYYYLGYQLARPWRKGRACTKAYPKPREPIETNMAGQLINVAWYVQ